MRSNNKGLQGTIMKEYVKAQWIQNVLGDLIYFPGGSLEAGIVDFEKACEEEEIELIRVPWRAYALLKDWMVENDRNRIIVSDREEDLKIIHRVLDIQEKLVNGSNQTVKKEGD